jgi:hypothetical protein
MCCMTQALADELQPRSEDEQRALQQQYQEYEDCEEHDLYLQAAEVENERGWRDDEVLTVYICMDITSSIYTKYAFAHVVLEIA